MSEDKDKKNNGWVKWVITLIIIAAIVILLWFLLRGKEDYITNDVNEVNISSLECAAAGDAVEGAFFTSVSAETTRHELKSTFREDKIDNMSYSFYATYESEAQTETAEANLHGQYNKYMGEKSMSQQSLNPNFSNLGDELKISLYTERSKMNNLMANFFFIDMDEFQKLGSYTLKDLEKIYENKGFSCTIHE